MARPSFTTDYQKRPWWEVDLGRECLVEEVVVYNRSDNPALAQRSVPLLIESVDSAGALTYLREVQQVFGGLGEPGPLRVQIAIPRRCSGIRITLERTGVLHLSKVEVLGEDYVQGSLITEAREGQGFSSPNEQNAPTEDVVGSSDPDMAAESAGHGWGAAENLPHGPPLDDKVEMTKQQAQKVRKSTWASMMQVLFRRHTNGPDDL